MPGQYPLHAYTFTLEALAATVTTLKAKGHISGSQLVLGTRGLARAKYGVMAHTVLSHWNIHTTRDFGQIVYNLIGAGLMRKSNNDNISDFDNVYDFEEAFGVGDYDYLEGLTEGEQECQGTC
jgi:uncharacterized repeat protein (TIGR04138 family)